jgi:hypothetical protein
MRLTISFHDIFSRARAQVSFARIARLGIVVILFFLFVLLFLDIFIFYRYSYRVINLRPEPVAQNIKIDREGLRKAVDILDARAEKFRALYGGSATP